MSKTRFCMVQASDEYGVYYIPTDESRRLAERLYVRITKLLTNVYAEIAAATEKKQAKTQAVRQAVGRKFTSVQMIADGRDMAKVYPKTRQSITELDRAIDLLDKKRDSLLHRRRVILRTFEAELAEI